MKCCFKRLAPCFLLIVSCAQAFAVDWPLFKGDVQRSGFVQQDVAVTRLGLDWQFRLPTTIVSSPVTAGDQLFVAGENGNLYAFDLPGRQLQWIRPTGAAISSTPAVSGELVYVLNMNGAFQAIDRNSGIEVWTFQTGGESRFSAIHYMGIKQTEQAIRDPWDFYLSSPLVANGRVHFGSSDGKLYTLDANSGELIWRYQTAGLVHASPALGGETLVIGDWYGIIHALDVSTGKRRWTHITEQDHEFSQWLGIQASPVIDDDRVYVGSRDSYLYALTLEDGELLWRYAMMSRSWVVTTPSVDHKRIYLGSSVPGYIIAVDKISGDEIWRTPTGAWNYSSPLILGGHVIAGAMNGDLLALDTASGEIVWRYQTDSAGEDHFGALDTETGGFDQSRLGSQDLHQALYGYMAYIMHLGAFLSSPAWHEAEMIITTSDGQILVFGEQTL